VARSTSTQILGWSDGNLLHSEYLGRRLFAEFGAKDELPCAKYCIRSTYANAEKHFTRPEVLLLTPRTCPIVTSPCTSETSPELLISRTMHSAALPPMTAFGQSTILRQKWESSVSDPPVA
jgi:hypothetical protein